MKLLLSLCIFAFALTLAGAPVPPPDKLLPADTVAVITVTDYQKAKRDWDKWALVRLWKDAAMKPFREKFMTKLKADLVEPLEREFGVKFADYKDLCQGQVTLAFTPSTAPDKKDSGFLLLVDTKDKASVLKTNLAALKQKWIDSGKVAKTDKIRDVEFTTLVFSSDDISKTVDKVLPSPKKDKAEEEPEEKKPAKKQEWIVGQSDSLLIVGSSVKDVEKILIRQSGGGVPALADHGPFAANYGTHFRDTPGYAWVNLKDIIASFSRKPQKAEQAGGSEEEEEPSPFDPSKMISVLGLGGLQSLSVSLKDSNEGSLAAFSIGAPESSRRGIARILSHDARDASPPPFVPADVVKFTRWRIDLAKTVTALEALITEINPMFPNVMKLLMENAGVDVRKNLFANLGDDVIAYEKKPKESTLVAMNEPPSLYLVSSPRAEQVAAAVKAISVAYSREPSRVKEREFLGRTVYSVSLPSPPREPGQPRIARPRALSFAASGSYVVFSMDTPLLEEYLRANEARPLRDTSGLAQAAEKVGGMGTGLFGFENQQESMRVLFEALKKDSASIDDLLSGSTLGKQLDTEEDKKFKDWFDLSLLPTFDQVSKYFGIAVWSGAVNSDGLTFRWFSPAPAVAK